MYSKHRLRNSRFGTKRQKLLGHEYRNYYSISVRNKPKQNALPDVLDTFVHYTSLIVTDVLILDELNSDNPVLLLSQKLGSL